MDGQTTPREAARASGQRARALALEYLAGGIYVAPPRHLFHIDLPMLMASVLEGTGGRDTPARRRLVGHQAIRQTVETMPPDVRTDIIGGVAGALAANNASLLETVWRWNAN